MRPLRVGIERASEDSRPPARCRAGAARQEARRDERRPGASPPAEDRHRRIVPRRQIVVRREAHAHAAGRHGLHLGQLALDEGGCRRAFPYRLQTIVGFPRIGEVEADPVHLGIVPFGQKEDGPGDGRAELWCRLTPEVVGDVAGDVYPEAVEVEALEPVRMVAIISRRNAGFW